MSTAVRRGVMASGSFSGAGMSGDQRWTDSAAMWATSKESGCSARWSRASRRVRGQREGAGAAAAEIRGGDGDQLAVAGAGGGRGGAGQQLRPPGDDQG